MFLLALEEEILRNRQEKLARLSKYREMLTFLLPDIIQQFEIWGAVGFISHHSGRTNGVYEIEEVLYFTLADLYGFSDWKSILIVDQERLLNGLLTGNELVE